MIAPLLYNSQLMALEHHFGFQIDRNLHRGGIIFYARKDVPLKLLLIENDTQNRDLRLSLRNENN